MKHKLLLSDTGNREIVQFNWYSVESDGRFELDHFIYCAYKETSVHFSLI